MGLFTQVPNQGVHIFSKHKSNMYTFVQPRGVSIFSPKTQKCHVYFCTTKVGGARRDPNHKSMYKCAYMYVHLLLSPPPPPDTMTKIVSSENPKKIHIIFNHTGTS